MNGPVIGSNTVLSLRAIWIFLPDRIRKQILRKIERLESGLHGDIKRLRRADAAYGVRMGDYRIFDLEGDVIVIRRIGDRKEFMTKTLEREIDRAVRRKRKELSEIREEVEDLLDYLDIVEARVKDAAKPRVSHEETKNRYA